MRLLTAALLALAALAAGFAHRPLQLEPRGYPADASAWVLPDGTVPALCHGGDVDGTSPGDDTRRAACDACRLTAAPGLAAVAAIPLAPPPTRVVDRLGHGVAALVGSLLPAPLSRGPPAVA